MIKNMIFLNMGILNSWFKEDRRVQDDSHFKKDTLYKIVSLGIVDCNKDFLLLDLDNTILHSVKIDDKYHTFYRPHLDVFIEKCKNYNVIIFTNATYLYALECIKPLNSLKPSYIIARNTEVAYPKTFEFVKNMLPIGNRRTIAIDDLKENFKDMENVIYIKPWTYDLIDDNELLYVLI
jgi:FMN phosphatase YigB (HAD superfamily)